MKMEQLRRAFEELGFSNVETFIASGNVIFDSNSKSTGALERKIEDHLKQTFGYPVATFIRSVPDLAKIAAHKPFDDSELTREGNTLYIGFLANPPDDAAKRKLLSLATELDDLRLHEREVYWLCRTTFRESSLSGAVLEKALGTATTLRNVNTVKRLASKYS